MKLTVKELRAIIRESIESSYAEPIDGLTGLMQEFDIPAQSRKKVSSILQSTIRHRGGPLDASYEVENSLFLPDIPGEFYSRAFDLARSEKSLNLEGRRVKISRRHISLVLREVTFGEKDPLTDAELQELNEAAPALIPVLARVAPRLIPALTRGVKGAARYLKKNPKMAFRIMKLVNKAKDKMPNLSKYMDEEEIPEDGSDVASSMEMIEDPPKEIKGELDKIMKTAGTQMKKSADCECPTPEEIAAAEEELK